jgi:hypothetical protein
LPGSREGGKKNEFKNMHLPSSGLTGYFSKLTTGKKMILCRESEIASFY